MEASQNSNFDALSLFMQADPVVKGIMLGLLASSLMSWGIIIEKTFSLWQQRRVDHAALRAFQFGSEPTGKGASHLYRKLENEAPLGSGWNDLIREKFIARARLGLSQMKREREFGLAFLATVASAAPFVGLFGTVWGIMNSFAHIAASKNTSLDVVAPGIAEALLATATGLLAAIPAAIFYNRLSAQATHSLTPAEELVQEMVIARAHAQSERHP
jgi:biopolymer transport protein TolQ